MSGPISLTSSFSEVKDYLWSLDSLPTDYEDPWSGCNVSFRWGRKGTDPDPDRPVVAYEVGNCEQGGLWAINNALRKALLIDLEGKTAVMSDPDPSTAFGALPPTKPIVAPAPAAAPAVAQYTGPLMSAAPEAVPMNGFLPAPTQVPVTRRGSVATRPSIQPAQYPTGPGITDPNLGVWDVIKGAGIGLITGGIPGAITGGIAGIVGGESGGPGTTVPGYTTPGNTFATGCPSGYEWRNGRCERVGVVGTIQRTLPGGATGYLPPTEYGGAVMGAFGVPALQPAAMQAVTLRCPPGSVLGKDDLCYQKGSITNKQRKWPKGPRPLLTGGEMKTLRKVKTLENKVKRAWQTAGKPGQTRCRRK